MRILVTAAALMLIALTALVLAVYLCGSGIVTRMLEGDENEYGDE